MARKKVKVSDFIEAIKRDEIEWNKGGWMQTTSGYSYFPWDIAFGDNKIEAACVIGIGCINSGIKVDFWKDKNSVVSLSDSQLRKRRAIATKVSDIISFNDSSNKAQSWEQARDYAIEQLTPYADEHFWAEEFDWEPFVERKVPVEA